MQEDVGYHHRPLPEFQLKSEDDPERKASKCRDEQRGECNLLSHQNQAARDEMEAVEKP